MAHWFMITVTGHDRPGIVAHMAGALAEAGCNLGAVAMTRLGGNVALMFTTEFDGRTRQLENVARPEAESLGLHAHVERAAPPPAHGARPDVRIRISGADRRGLLARATAALAEAGLHILGLVGDVTGGRYEVRLDGRATEGVAAVRSAVEILAADGLEVEMECPEQRGG